jgi:predicted protein tyrosine phosphatase
MELEIGICGAADVIAILNNAEQAGVPYDGVISLEPERARGGQRAPRVAQELKAPIWNDHQIILQFADTQLNIPTGPKRHHLQSGFDFVDRHAVEGRATRILIHCHRGRSRSTAMALALLRRAEGPGSEAACLAMIKLIRPIAMPNLMVLKHADDLLQGSGYPEQAANDGPLVAVVKNDLKLLSRRGLESHIRHWATNAWEVLKMGGREAGHTLHLRARPTAPQP